MADGQIASLMRQLHRLVGSRSVPDQSDGQLLDHFVRYQDQAAFTVLVQRHGPMVLGVCRRVLQDADAEDVFQATFLVLARRAQSLRPYGSLGNWLHTIAYRLALRTRARGARRQERERQVVDVPGPAGNGAGAWADLRPVLDAELDRLPVKYRTPVVLCYLEGKTNEEAARELGWPVGTVKIRLSRARDLLKTRLTQRGMALSAGLLTAQLAEEASAAVAAALLESTTEAAALFAAGNTVAAGAVAARAVPIAQGALQAMTLNKLQGVFVLLLALGLLGAGTGALMSFPVEPGTLAAAEAVVPAPVAGPEAPAADKPAADRKLNLGSRSRPIHRALSQNVTLDEIKPGTTLKEAIALISDRYKMPIFIDKPAFESIGLAKVEDQPVELPKMTDARLSTVLKRLLRQIRGDVYHGTFMVRPDHVELTTSYHQMAETPSELPDHPAVMALGGDPVVPRELLGDTTRKVTPVVHMDVDNRSVATALRDLAEQAEIDIILDRRAAEKAQTLVDLTLNNTLFDTVLGLLTDAADLEWMWVDNVAYVSTKEDVKARKERKRARELEKIKLAREGQDLNNQPIPGGVGPPPAKPTLVRPGPPPG